MAVQFNRGSFPDAYLDWYLALDRRVVPGTTRRHYDLDIQTRYVQWQQEQMISAVRKGGR